MVLKTFNLDEETYRKFSEFCKENGFSMSKQVNFFIQSQMADKKEVREEYLKKLDRISKGKFIKFSSMEEFDRHFKSKNA
ncbi:MAG: hypothetical protein NTU63_00740 [Candidatus Pacearchaeota archaeon]|nr:hypothetical protein [Candidatus Pacearchaeota archaeon]